MSTLALPILQARFSYLDSILYLDFIGVTIKLNYFIDRLLFDVDNGAPNGTRTRMDFTPRDFKSLVSANSTTGALLVQVKGLEPLRLSAQEPKSCVSANFTIPAYWSP